MTRVPWCLLLALAACGGGQRRAGLVQRELPRDITRWLLCDECTEGELDSVVALGDGAIDPLASALRGPSPAATENLRRQTEAMYDRLPGDTVGRGRYVAYYLANYKARYQRRAAVALDSIGTARAEQVLHDAFRTGGYRDDVMRALGRAVGLSVVVDSGAVQEAPVDSQVRADPSILVGGTPGGGVSGIQVRFRVDSGGGRVSDTTTSTDASGRASVRWWLGHSDSVNVLTALAAGSVVRFRALGHPVGLRLVFVVQPTSVRNGQRMTSPVRIAVQDGWGVTQVSLNDPDGLFITVEGTSTHARIPIVNGVAELTNIRFHGGGKTRIVATRIHSPPAYSTPFTILSP